MYRGGGRKLPLQTLPALCGQLLEFFPQRLDHIAHPIEALIMATGKILPGACKHQQLFDGVHQLVNALNQWPTLRDSLFFH
ncbi:hypothetical protein D3C75_1170740 [compost metagenome]